MSKFFAKADDSSSGEDSSDNEQDKQTNVKQKGVIKGGKINL